jgi:hypothetical protein
MERAVVDPASARVRAAAARRRVETDLSFQSRMANVERIYDQLMETCGRGEHSRAAAVREAELSSRG